MKVIVEAHEEWIKESPWCARAQVDSGLVTITVGDTENFSSIQIDHDEAERFAQMLQEVVAQARIINR